MISALVLGGVPRVVWVPAMNTAMWEHPLVQRNVSTLQALGQHVLTPAMGALAAKGEGSGLGRMPEPEAITAYLTRLLGPRDLARADGFWSPPDRPVSIWTRCVTCQTRRRARWGFAVAEAARDRGADVTLVSGPVSLADPVGVKTVRVESAEEMLAALSAAFDQTDVVVMSAAVADWRTADVLTEKEPKMGQEQTLNLVRTPDILSTLAPRKERQVLVGFAMETHEGVARAADKARRKQLELICLNYPTREGSAFGGDDNEVTLVTPEGEAETLPRMSKRAVADAIFDRVVTLIESRSKGG